MVLQTSIEVHKNKKNIKTKEGWRKGGKKTNLF
jgi:hypothetical protein